MKIVKLYNKYFFNFSNIIVIISLLLFLSVSFFLSINNLNNELSYEEVLQYYFENCLYYSKFIIVIYSSYIFMRLKNERNEYILNIVICAGYSKKKNYIFMMITYLFILILFVTITFTMFLIIGYISKHYFIYKIEYIISFFYILLLGIYYGFLSYFVMMIFDNQFYFLVVILLFFVSDLLIQFDEIIKYILMFFLPNINNYNGMLNINWLYVIITIVIIFAFNFILYLNKDLKN